MPAETKTGPPYLGRHLLIFVLAGVPPGSMLLPLTRPLAMNGNLDMGEVYADPVGMPLF